MRKWFIRIGAGIALLFGAIIIFAISAETDHSAVRHFAKNDGLKTIKDDWDGTPVDQKGRFINAEFPFLPSTFDLLKWKLSENPQQAEKDNNTYKLNTQDPSEFLDGNDDGVLWLGHASVLVRLAGKVILFDPVFGDPAFIERYFELPSPIEKLKQVDYVVISHDHFDHMDETSITAIAQKFPKARFLAGLGSEDLLTQFVGDSSRVETAGWYQEFSGPGDLKITFVPVRHWSRRGLFDTNERLWGGFVVQGGGKTIYHGGDSGFGSHYTEMAGVFPEIDYFIVGIGSYEPRWFMKPNHNDPEEALRAFADSKARVLIPVHYATFNMTDEPPGEPLQRLLKAADKAGLRARMRPLDIYQSVNFKNGE